MALETSTVIKAPVKNMSGQDLKELAGMISDYSRVSIEVTKADRPGEQDTYSIVVTQFSTPTSGGRG